MSTLIKGLRIPPIGVRDCVIAFKDNYLLITDLCGNTIFEGEYVEVPTPHGRLVDADELLKAFKKACEQDGHWVNFFALVESAPTIVEAEVSE